MFLHKERKAFTLAEILITLGIIGVISAMTIPSLLTNINSKKFKSIFKKDISTLTQMVKLAEANDGEISQQMGVVGLLLVVDVTVQMIKQA